LLIDFYSLYPNLAKWVAMAAGTARLQAAQCRSLCYYKHYGWMGTVVVTLPDILPCVLRAGMGPLGKGRSSPALWRNIQRYWILRRICRSINCWTNRLRRGCHACILWSMSLRTAQDTPY